MRAMTDLIREASNLSIQPSNGSAGLNFMLRGVGMADHIFARRQVEAGIRDSDTTNGERVRTRMRKDFEIEIGSAFGLLQGRIWRIGAWATMPRSTRCCSRWARWKPYCTPKATALPWMQALPLTAPPP